MTKQHALDNLKRELIQELGDPADGDWAFVTRIFEAGANWRQERDANLLEDYGLRVFSEHDMLLRQGSAMLRSLSTLIRKESFGAEKETK